MNTYVYLINKASGHIKIGVSNDPEKRIKTLQTANFEKLTIMAKFPFPSRMQAFEFEGILHKRFKKDRISGEWFKACISRKFWTYLDNIPDFVDYRFTPSLAKEEIDHLNSIIQY